MEGQRGERAEDKEEYVLVDDGLGGEAVEVGAEGGGVVRLGERGWVRESGGRGNGGALDARPG